jgi:hypothetical protein
MTETTTAPAFAGWAVLELMGHRRRVGMVSEVEIAGGKLLRIDIPTDGGDITEFYGAASIYALRPVSEEIARRAASEMADPRPVRPVEYREREPERPAIPATRGLGLDDDPGGDQDEMPF